MINTRFSLLIAGACAALLGPVGCGGDVGAPIPPTVILISLDTVRADNLSCYGGPEGATPALDRFAAGGTRFQNCSSSAPWTMPSHASMFTGLYPFEHGAHTFLPGEGHRGDNVFALDTRFETLAEALGARGYRTAGIVSNSIYLRPGLGLDAGFQTWDVRRQRGAQVTDRALAWLDQGGAGEGDRPAFLFVNYMDAHRPYASGESEAETRGKLDDLIDQVMVRGEAPGPAGASVRAMHQRAVSALDEELGRLFAGLEERGVLESALVIVTADHGEAFGEHGVVEHSKDIYEELVSVPLIVKGPGQVEGSVEELRASSVDVPGIVAAALEGTEATSAVGIFPRRPGTHSVIVENHYSRLKDLARFGTRFQRRRYALYDGGWKLLATSNGDLELYDLGTDGPEANNVAEKESARAAGMAARLKALLAATAFDGPRVLPGQLTPEQRDDMSELGYGR